jgi:hypothetical protein
MMGASGIGSKDMGDLGRGGGQGEGDTGKKSLQQKPMTL